MAPAADVEAVRPLASPTPGADAELRAAAAQARSQAAPGAERRGTLVAVREAPDGSGLCDLLTWSGVLLRDLSLQDLQEVGRGLATNSLDLPSMLQEPKESDPSLFRAGDIVEIGGLESEAGKAMNGQKVVVAKYHQDLNRVEVRFADQKRVKLKPENLSRVAVGPNDSVEVFGLDSEGGRPLNGQQGVVTRFVEEKGRFEVRLGEKLVSLKCENLKRLDGSGISIDQTQFAAMMRELRDAYGSSAALQDCFAKRAESPAWYESFTVVMRELQAPVFQRYNYSGGKRGIDRLREDTRRAVLAGDAEVAKLSREMAYQLHVCPKGEGTDDGGDFTVEARQRVAVHARLLAWRQVGQLVAEKGMDKLREELLDEGRVVTATDVQGSRDVDEAVRQRLAVALARRAFHAVLGELLAKRPELLGAEPCAWQAPGGQQAITAAVLQQLHDRGWAVIDGAFSSSTAAAAGRELGGLHHCSRLRQSVSVVNQGAKFSHLRFALDEERAHLRLCLPSLLETSAFLCALPAAIKAHDKTGLLAGLRVDPTTKVLANEPGVAHKVHLDWKGGDQNLRMVTCILYLNDESFSEQDEGALRIYHDLAPEEGSAVRIAPPPSDAPHTDLAPICGRLVVFLSRRVWHEALPAKRDRYGITLWVPALP